MNSNNQSTENQPPSMPPPEQVAPQARRVMRLCNKVALATIDRQTGAPFLSLTGIATRLDATPVLLMSSLSQHTQNLHQDDRISLLFDGTGDHSNPLTENRVTLSGKVVESQREEAARRFIMRNPKAFYAGFADFSFYELELENAHFVGGFGTALSIPADILLLPESECADLLETEVDIIQQMNAQQSEDVRNMAVNLLKANDGNWLLTGADPEGCDFVLRKQRLRLDFPHHATNGAQLRELLMELGKKARLS